MNPKILDTISSMVKLNIDIEKIINLYNEGLSAAKIGIIVNCNAGTIQNRLIKEGITLRKGNTRFSYDKDYFKKIDTKDKAYFLGLLFADGFIFGNPKQGFGIELQEKDGKILEVFNKYLNYNKPLFKKQSLNQNHQSKYILSVYGKEIKDDLIRLGCINNKSLILKFPTEEQVPKHLIHHFIRGYFDGDGSLSVANTKHKSGRITFVGTEDFLNGIKKELLYYTISSSELYNITKGKNTYVFTINLNKSLIELREYLYKDCDDIYIERKKEKFDSLSLRNFTNKDKKCSIINCSKNSECSGLCQYHYDLKRRNNSKFLEQSNAR